MHENAVLCSILEELHFFRKFMLGSEFIQSIYDIEQMYNFPVKGWSCNYFLLQIKFFEKVIKFSYFLVLRYVACTKMLRNTQSSIFPL